LVVAAGSIKFVLCEILLAFYLYLFVFFLFTCARFFLFGQSKAAVRVRLFIDAPDNATNAAAKAMAAVRTPVRVKRPRGGIGSKDIVLGCVVIPLTTIAAQQEEIGLSSAVDESLEGVAAVSTDVEKAWDASLAGLPFSGPTKDLENEKGGSGAANGVDHSGVGGPAGEKDRNLDDNTPWVDQWLDLHDNPSGRPTGGSSWNSDDQGSVNSSQTSSSKASSYSSPPRSFKISPQRRSTMAMTFVAGTLRPAFLNGSDQRNRSGPPNSKVKRLCAGTKKKSRKSHL